MFDTNCVPEISFGVDLMYSFAASIVLHQRVAYFCRRAKTITNTMGSCMAKGMSKTDRALYEARNLAKADHGMRELNMLLDDPVNEKDWAEICALMALDHNAGVLRLIQVRPDEWWRREAVLHAGLTDAQIEILCARGLAAHARAPGGGSASGGTGIQMLHLDFNRIGPRGAEALARVIAEVSTLRCLTLNGNELADAGAKALAGALPSACSRFYRLDLRSHNLLQHQILS